MKVPGALEALREECDLVGRAVLGLSEEAFARPTRCPAWTVKGLLAHMHRDLERIIVGLGEEEPQEVDTDAVSYWRAFDPSVDSRSIADRASARADSYGTGRELAVVWADLSGHVLDLADRTEPFRSISTWGPNMAFDDFLKTRALEITVHGLDLADALGREPWATGAGLAVVRETLAGLLGQDPPQELGWDDRTLAEIGTGRRALSQGERTILGSLADRFPLLA